MTSVAFHIQLISSRKKIVQLNYVEMSGSGLPFNDIYKVLRVFI
jgi:hypothetical protein